MFLLLFLHVPLQSSHQCFALKSKLRLSHQSCPTAALHLCGSSPLTDVTSDASHWRRVQQKSPASHRCSCSSDRRRSWEGGRVWTHCRGSAAMGNAQEKPPGSGGGAARPDQATAAGSGTRSRGGGGGEKPQINRAPEKGVANGTQGGGSPAGGHEEQGSPAVDTSYLDAPAGALPPHLARLKNEGNHLFKHGQFGDALEKYSQAIEGCAEAGGSLSFSSEQHFIQYKQLSRN